MFEYVISPGQNIFSYGRFYTIEKTQNFIWLKKSEFIKAEHTLIVDVGLVFSMEGMHHTKFKIVRLGQWLGVVEFKGEIV